MQPLAPMHAPVPVLHGTPLQQSLSTWQPCPKSEQLKPPPSLGGG